MLGSFTAPPATVPVAGENSRSADWLLSATNGWAHGSAMPAVATVLAAGAAVLIAVVALFLVAALSPF
jgi:hypothetical protein